MKFEMNYDQKMFGKRLKEIRKANGYTQEKLAEALLITPQSVLNIEKGKTACAPDHLVHICELFHISSDELYFGEHMPAERQMGVETNKDIWRLIEGCTEEEKKRVAADLKF